MPSYSAELDSLLVKKQAALGRQLFPQETAALCVGLVETWFERGQTEGLIRYLLSEFSREGGQQEISTLGRLLADKQDVDSLQTLFRGLISRRVKAFCQWWPRAQTANIGYMRSAAHAMAEAMDVYVEYCVWLDKLGRRAEYEDLKAEMLRLQARLSVSKILSVKTAPERDDA
jgi:hypothetical protein